MRIESITKVLGFGAQNSLPQGTCCGNIGAGVVFYLMEKKDMNAEAILPLQYQDVGLLDISGLTNDLPEVLLSTDYHSYESVRLFVYYVAGEIGSSAVAIKRLNALIFYGDIDGDFAKILARI